MEQTTLINFKRERDFGEVFNVTFQFLKQEYKGIGRSFAFFVLPVLLIAAVLNVFVGLEQQKVAQDLTQMDPMAGGNPFAAVGSTFVYTFFTILLYLISFAVLKCMVYSYIKLYIEKGPGAFSTDDVWSGITKIIFPVLGTSLLVGLLVGVGFILCVIPGIYVGVSLSLIYMTLVFEQNGFGDAFSRSFRLTAKKWWVTLGLIVVSYLIIYGITLVFSIPGMIMGITTVFTMQNPEEFIGFSTGFYIYSSVINLISYTLFIIPTLVIAFHYFSIVEEIDTPTLEQNIDQIS